MLNTPVQAAAEGMPVSNKMTRRAALCSIASLSALGGATAAIAQPMRASRLADLIDAHKATYSAFMAALDAEQEDRRDVSLQEASFAAGRAEDEALCAILEYRPVSQADAIAKVAYLGPLNKLGSLDQQIHMDHLLASLLPEGEWLPSEWWGWHTEYEIEVAS